MNSKVVFEPIPSRRAFEEVCDRIRAQVVSGALRPGDKLPPERQLAEQLGVSRLAVREALRSLENAGVVVLQRGPKGGAFIQGAGGSKLTELMQDMLDLGTFPLSDLTEARIFFLESVARLACERATQEELDQLEDNVRMSELLVDSATREKRIELAGEFYTLLAATTKNKVMMMVVKSLTDIVRSVLLSIELYPSKELTLSRRGLMEQLRARNADRAAKELHAHLRKVHEHMIRHGALPNVSARG
ncbi:MAG: FadR family transcriptional regulator [Burkholderiales bacterium]|nr:FadR family transcriptional regulator [Burkholderiales bacterium]